MEGSVFGAVLSLAYFLLFQVCGVILTHCFFKHERSFVSLVIGSSVGSVLLMWLPVLVAFFLGFTLSAHILACVLLLILTGISAYFKRSKLNTDVSVRSFIRAEYLLCVPLGLFCIFVFLLLHSFKYVNGEIWSSQCTYGDMSMHFGFITAIAEQGVFPPEYSILPGTKLSYPFLSDSISSSLYLLGASLRFAYLLPMVFAGAQVFFGAWLFLKQWLKDNIKAVVAMLLFFLNGGFGFAYFMSDLGDNCYNFTRIFTEFYETPTNLVDENIRWVNVIVDMLVPQRATLFGWAVLFPLLYILYRAVHERCDDYFAPAAVIAGGMVMIHTHSFLALGIICGAWMMFDLAGRAGVLSRVFCGFKVAAIALPIFCALIGCIVPGVLPRSSSIWLLLVITVAGVFVIMLCILLLKAYAMRRSCRLLRTWGVFFIITTLLSVPQLITWTFTQADSNGFVRGWFNWANIDDSYLWFYIVNIGVVALAVIPALFSLGRRTFSVAAPSVLIWFMCEFVVFQPNDYDNNKLLYVAYFLLCGAVASFLVDAFRKLRGIRGRSIAAVICVVLCTVSAVLTIAREGISGYCLYGSVQLEIADFISEETEPRDTVLTNMRHNNEVAALTGRNIVCGSPSYLYFHGLDYSVQQNAAAAMFSSPKSNIDKFEELEVDYVLVSAFERDSYDIDEAELAELFQCVYDENGIRLYKVE